MIHDGRSNSYINIVRIALYEEPRIFEGYNFPKAYPIPFKMTLVSTLTVGAFGRSGLLNVLRT